MPSSFVWSVLALLLAPGLARAASTLNFPKLAFENDRYTGVAIANPSSQDASVTLTAYGAGGQPLAGAGFVNPVALTIKANQQIAKLTTELFGTGLAATTIGWLQATSATDGLTGFFLFLDGRVTLLDGADLPPPAQKLAFHRVRVASGYSTEIDIVNPSSAAANVQAELVSAGVPRVPKLFTIPAKGMTRVDAATFFDVNDVSAAAYVLVQCDVEIAGIEFVTNPAGELLGLNGRRASEQLDRLAFPQLAVLGGYTTELGVINYSASPVILTITALRPSGELYDTADLKNNPVTRTLGGGESLREDLQTMFGFAGGTTLTGWVEVKSTADAINGYLTYGIPASGAAAAVTTASQGRTRALFSHIATSGYFTGVAALNAGALAANIRIVALRPTGEVLGSYDGVLQPGERIAKLVGTSELIPEAANQNGGLIWVKSDLPIFLASVFGSTEVLSNVPPQDAPDTYNPDAGIAALKMKPPLAILRPGQAQVFQVEGVGGVLQWKVNGAAGGQTSTGTVTASGIFTAPPTVPSRQVATITGETSQQAAGASVDVLDKTTLVGGLRVVQSVAYLESLSKLYAAEFTALGSFTGLLPETAAVENGNSQISEVAAGGAKTTVATWSGENIAKLLSFHAVDGREYLLASGQIGGRIIRFDPVTRQSRDVVTGLNEPSALVFDPPTGDLLVAEKDKVTTVARSVIEAGLSPAAAAPGDREDPTYAAPGRRDALPASIPASGAAGVAVNRCARRLYFTLPADGLLVEYDPATGKLRTVLSGLRNPGALLGVYRKGSSCPNGFHLLLSERGLDRTLLVFPRDGTFVEWLSFTGIRDFLFLPRGNPFTPREGILVGENAGSVGSLALVRVSDLYDSSPPNPPDLEETGGEPKADVAVTGSAQPEPVAVGATLTYTITVINKGPAAASSITLTDRLPGALAFVSATSPQGTCANVRGTVACSLGSLGLNRQAVVTLRVTVNGRPADGVVTSTVAVTAREIDPDVSNNTTSARTTVLSATGTTLQVTTQAAVWTAGAANTLTVTARDASGGVLTSYRGSVRFTSTDASATLPPSYTFTAADAGTHTFAGVTLRTAGSQALTATDTTFASVTGSRTVSVGAADASSFQITLPSSVAAGASATVTVTAVDLWGNVAIAYTGTVRFTSSDPGAVLPADYAFTSSDAGVHTFPNGLTLKTAGTQNIKVSDTVVAFLAGTQTVTVTAAPGASR